jgi:hypothetical protein
VRIFGTSKVYSTGSAAWGYGDFLMSGSVGQAEIAVTGSGISGVAMENVATGASVYSEILLLPTLSAFCDNTP